MSTRAYRLGTKRRRSRGMTLLGLAVAFPAVFAGCGRVIVEPMGSSSSAASAELTGGTGGGGSTSDTADSTTSSGGGTGGASILTISFSGRAVEVSDGTPVDGALVCALGKIQVPCAVSDEGGNFSLILPANYETGLSLVKTGYGGVAVAFLTAGHDSSGWVIGMPQVGGLTTYYEAAGSPYPDSGKGFLDVGAINGESQQRIVGASFSLHPPSGSGPFYADSEGAPDKSLSGTSMAGYARFAGVNPGEVEVVLSTDMLLCDWDVVEGEASVGQVAFGGWPSPTVNAVRLPILAGLETHFVFKCF